MRAERRKTIRQCGIEHLQCGPGGIDRDHIGQSAGTAIRGEGVGTVSICLEPGVPVDLWCFYSTDLLTDRISGLILPGLYQLTALERKKQNGAVRSAKPLFCCGDIKQPERSGTRIATVDQAER